MNQDLFSTIEAWHAAGEAVALATVVKIYGSAPQPLGAKMIVSGGGSMQGSVSGGCVEGAVVQEALDVLVTGTPRLVAYGIADEWAKGAGLACGGMIEVFIEPLPDDFMSNYAPPLQAALKAGVPAAAVTIIGCARDRGHGDAVQRSTAEGGPRIGAKLLIVADEEIQGTLGGAALNQAGLAEAQRAVKSQHAIRIQADDCDLFIDPFLPAKRLLIVGAVHTAIPLVTFARELGFHTTVLDARGVFATEERFAHADRLLVQWPADALSELGLDAASYVVVLTHDPKIDNPALMTALNSPARYVGALGSLRTHITRCNALRELGASDAQLARIHAPIGLDLGGRRPEEIALAIMAEIVAVEHVKH